MAVNTTVVRVDYAGNGATTVFSVPFMFLANSDLYVVLIDDTLLTQVVQVLDTDYSVTGAGDEAGGSLTMVTAPPSGKTLVIVRRTERKQPDDYPLAGPFPSTTAENSLDRNLLITQELGDAVDRAAVLPDNYAGACDPTLPYPAVDKFLAFANDALSIVAVDPGSVALAVPADGSVTIAKMLEDEYTAKLGSPVTVTSSPTMILSVNVGNVNVGDRLEIEAICRIDKTAGGGGFISLNLSKLTGTATIVFGQDSAGAVEQWEANASEVFQKILKATAQVTVDGTLTLRLEGSSGSYNATAQSAQFFVRKRRTV